MLLKDNHSELITNKYSKIWVWLYKFLKGDQRSSLGKIILNRIANLEGGENTSKTIRELFLKDFNIEVGVHSYGGVFMPKAFSQNVQIGRYCSISAGVRAYTENHPLNRISTHPYFYGAEMSLLKNSFDLIIGNDVWIGYGAIILPGCNYIGDGAIIGAGAVITKDVEPYSIVGGNPAKVLKKRERIEDEIYYQWWEKSKLELEALQSKKN